MATPINPIHDADPLSEPPPPYLPSSSSSPPPANPGFCPLAILERQRNAIPGGGMTAAAYFSPCRSCGYLVSDEIPSAYKLGWEGWIDPSVNFRWESHLPASSLYSALGTPEKDTSDRKNFAAGKVPEMVEIGKANAGWFGGRVEERKGEQLACWICWEYEKKWTGGMEVEEWYKHMRRHFFVEGYRICVGKTGGMQRRRNCKVGGERAFCPKIHS